MYAGLFRRYSAAVKTQYRLMLPYSILPAVGLLLLGPLFFSPANLDAPAAAAVLERYVVLAGALLLTPLPLPEQAPGVGEAVEAKYTSQTGVLALRLLLLLPLTLVFSGGACGIMLALGSRFSFLRFWLGGAAGMAALGAAGLLTFVLTQNWVAGYFVPVCYYMLCTALGNKLGVLYLFSLGQGSVREKYWLAGMALLLCAAALAVRHARSRAGVRVAQ